MKRKNSKSRAKKNHRLGRMGEKIIAEKLHLKPTPHKALDIVDFVTGIAYEVKTMSAMSKDLKIHIYVLRGVLIAKVEVYSCELKQHIMRWYIGRWKMVDGSLLVERWKMVDGSLLVGGVSKKENKEDK